MSDPSRPRVTGSQLAVLWNLTSGRISHFVKDGRIVKGSDGKFDYIDCMAFRDAQIGADEVRTLLQTVGNRHGTQPPKIFDHITEAQRDLSFDELLGIEPSISSSPPTIIDKALSNQTELTRLRIEEGRGRIRRQQLKDDKDAGLLVARSEMRRAGQDVAKQILNILNGLPAEVAHLVDRETRAQVRRAVQLRIEQAQHALHEAVSFAVDEDDDE